MQLTAASSDMKSDAAAAHPPKSPRQGKGYRTGNLKMVTQAPPVVLSMQQYVQPNPPHQSPPFRSRAFEVIAEVQETHEERMEERKMRRCVCIAVIGVAVFALTLGLTLKYV